MPTLNSMPRSLGRRTWAWVFAVALFACALRFLGIWHEYPFSFYGDEQQMVKQALIYGSGDFNPYRTGMNASKPAFYTYLLFIEYGVLFVFGKLAGWWGDANAFVVEFLHRPGPWYVIGRSTTALFGVATVVLVALSGEKYLGRRVGIVAALLLCVSLGHIITCQHVKADNPTAFFSLLAMWFLLAFINNERVRYLVLASMAAGIGMATKYYSVFLAPIFIIAIVLVANRVNAPASKSLVAFGGSVIKFGAISLVVGMLSFFVFTPYTFLDSQGLEFLLGEISVLGDKAAAITGTAAEGQGGRQDYEFRGHVDYLTAVEEFVYTLGKLTGFGLLATVAGFFGLLYCLIRPTPTRILIATFPLFFSIVAIVVRPGFAVVRHQTQIYPFLALAGGLVLVLLFDVIRRRSAAAAWLFTGIGAVAIGVQLYFVFERAWVVSHTDPRSAAVAWINDNVAPGSGVLIGNNIVDLVAAEETLDARERQVTELIASGQVPKSVVSRMANTGRRVELQRLLAQNRKSYLIHQFEHPWWLRRDKDLGERFFLSESDVFMEPPSRKFGVSTLEDYIDRGVRYVVVGDKFRQFYGSRNDRYPYYVALFDAIYDSCQLANFDRHPSGWGSDTVRIFDIVENCDG